VRRLIMLVALSVSVSASAQELPAGPGRDQVTLRCLTCHEIDLIAQQRLSPAAWGREVDKMTRWGAGVDAAEREGLVAYLASHFPPGAAEGTVASVNGEATVTRACLVCHEADLVAAQRLAPAAWTREVEKMMRWGAVVNDSEKAALVEYLASRYPVR
jgi:cytochrome c2